MLGFLKPKDRPVIKRHVVESYLRREIRKPTHENIAAEVESWFSLPNDDVFFAHALDLDTRWKAGVPKIGSEVLHWTVFRDQKRIHRWVLRRNVRLQALYTGDTDREMVSVNGNMVRFAALAAKREEYQRPVDPGTVIGIEGTNPCGDEPIQLIDGRHRVVTMAVKGRVKKTDVYLRIKYASPFRE